jgi:AmmeMemoRadiSam system protein B
MISPDYIPVLRWPLDIRRSVVEGVECMMLRDPIGVAEDPAIVPLELMAIITRFDGSRTVADILKEGAAYGVTLKIISDVIESLVDLGLLDTQSVREKLEKLKAEYAKATTRECSLSGRAYPADVNGLRSLIDDYKRKAPDLTSAVNGAQVSAVMCPHIDYHRGWKTYAQCAHILDKLSAPDIIIFFGTAHQFSKSIFSLSRKIHSCPLGDFHPAAQALDKLEIFTEGKNFYDDEFNHRTEHSIELQLPIVAHSFSNAKLPQIIPILVGSFHSCFESGLSPRAIEEVDKFICALGDTLSWLIDSDKKVLLYSGVDLSHIGQHFGDLVRSDQNRLREVENSDKALLDLAFAMEPEELFNFQAQAKDKNRVCGYSSLYTMLSAMKRAGVSAKGNLVEYRQAVDTDSDCTVSFATAYWQNAD